MTDTSLRNFDLGDYACFQVDGDDAGTFLQGQLSSDLQNLPAGGGGCRYHAGAHGTAVDVNRAGAALRDAATELRAREAGIVAYHPQQGCRRIDVEVA